MLPDSFAGNWIYRRFVNMPDLLPFLDPQNTNSTDIQRWSRYLFGQSVMAFHPSGTAACQGSFHMGDDTSPLDMELLGKIEVRYGVTMLKWRARGIKDRHRRHRHASCAIRPRHQPDFVTWNA